jgi:hypothetical protein
MFNLLQIIHLDGSDSTTSAHSLVAHLTGAGESLPGVLAAHAGPTLPRALNGGQLMWRLRFNSEQDYRACVSSALWRSQVLTALNSERGVCVDSIAYRIDFSHSTGARSREGIWRCLVMSVDANARVEDVRQLQRDLLLMPQLIPSIRDWALGHAVSTRGRRRWTHVWEQEFDNLRGLEGDYMMHPVHWGLVDGWFDPECPQRIVDPFLIHAAFDIRQGVIA